MTVDDIFRDGAYNVYLEWPYLVLDFEATSYLATDPSTDIYLACWYIVHEDGTIEKKHQFADEYGQQELLNDIRSVKFVVAQNAKYELQLLKRCGLELRDVVVYCTVLGAWVIDGNQAKPRDLNSLAKRYNIPFTKLNTIKKYFDAGLSVKDAPKSWVLEYCYRDVELTHAVFVNQLQEVWARSLWHIVYMRNLTCACLADIEFNGMTLDSTRVEDEFKKVTDELDDLKTKLAAISGGLNLNSSKQLITLLYDTLKFDPPKDHRGKVYTTAKGALSTDTKTLALLRPKTEEQQNFLDYYRRYNKLTSLLEKNLEFFAGVVKERGGTFRAVFNQGVTKTHRLSSSGIPLLFSGSKKPKSVQFQNLPREYKKLFKSREGYKLVEGDGSMLEFRVAADLGQDPVAMQELADSVDIHTNTAKVFLDDGTQEEFKGLSLKEARQPAKPQTFRPLYGGRGNTDAEKNYAEFFKDKYKAIAEEQRKWTLKVLNDKRLRTRYGLVFYWPDTKMERGGWVNNTTSIYNTPIQGLATAEIIPIALVAYWHLTRDKDVRILNTVHDSIVAEVPEDSVQWNEEVMRKCFTDVVYDVLKRIYNYTFTTALGTGIKVADHWGDTKQEVVYNCFPDGTKRRTLKE